MSCCASSAHFRGLHIGNSLQKTDSPFFFFLVFRVWYPRILCFSESDTSRWLTDPSAAPVERFKGQETVSSGQAILHCQSHDLLFTKVLRSSPQQSSISSFIQKWHHRMINKGSSALEAARVRDVRNKMQKRKRKKRERWQHRERWIGRQTFAKEKEAQRLRCPDLGGVIYSWDKSPCLRSRWV